MSNAGGETSRGCLIAAGVVIAIVFVAFWGLIAWSILDERDDRAADAAVAAVAAADPRMKRPLVSSTGRLAFVVQHRGETVHVVNASGTQLAQVSRVPRGSFVTGPLWSPDGTRLTFASDDTVHTVHTVGDPSTWRTSIDRNVRLPIWSPDGRRAVLLTTEGRGHTWNLLVSDGSTSVDITRGWPAAGYGSSLDVVWSSDSRRFAFVRTQGIGKTRPGNIYVVNADGSELTSVTHYYGDDWTKVENLAWSPDGQRFAYSNGGAIVTVAADGSDQAEFGHTVRYTWRFPAWSPDSRLLAWSNEHSIVVSGPRGEEPRELTRGRAAGTMPAWSPDGARIAFADLWNAKLYVMNSDGSGLTLLAEMPGDRLHPPTLHRPAWQPQTP